jgi:hypothetical protein
MFHVVRVQFFRIFWGEEQTGWIFYAYNFIISIPALLLSIWFPNVGSLLGYAGSFAGLFTIYLLPVAVHLKRMYLEIYNPVLLKMLERRIIKSYDDIGKYEFYYKDYKSYIAKDMMPQNDELTVNLIEPAARSVTLNVTFKEDLSIIDKPYSNRYDSFSSKEGILKSTVESQMTDILNEIKLEKENGLGPTKFSYIVSFSIDAVAIVYGFGIFFIQFIQV